MRVCSVDLAGQSQEFIAEELITEFPSELSGQQIFALGLADRPVDPQHQVGRQ